MNCLGHKKVVLLTSELQAMQIDKEVFSQVREHGLKSEGGWPSGKLRLTLLISFGGLLALMVIAGLDALRLARQLHTQEEEIRQTFLAHTQPLLVLSSSIYVYNDRIQEYLMSQDPQADGLTAEEFSRLTAEINSTIKKYPENRQPEERALLVSLEQLFTEQQGLLNPVLSWSREERHRQAWRFLNEEVLPQRSRIQETSEKSHFGIVNNSARQTGRCSEVFRAYKRGKQDCWR